MVYKEYPVIGGDMAVVGSLAGQCAGLQDQFWAMNHWLYTNNARWRGADPFGQVQQAAAELGLDTAAFDACMDERTPFDLIVADFQEGQQYGIRGTPNFVVNGHLLQGLLPFDQFSVIIDALIQQAESGALPVNVATVTPTATPDRDFDLSTAAAKGDPDAPVTIVEFSDYQCPFCLRHYQNTLPSIQRYIDAGQVRYVFKDFTPTLFNPSYHPQAVAAAEAARCAGAQGAYWPMHDRLFDDQADWNNNSDAATVFARFAAELSLDVDAFSTCLESNEFLDRVAADLQEGIAAGVEGTPAFFINGVFISGAQPFEVFEQVIESLLRQ